MARATHHCDGRDRNREQKHLARDRIVADAQPPQPSQHGPQYDGSSTTVPGFTADQLRALSEGSNSGALPSNMTASEAKAKANSWTRVVKVVSLKHERRQCPSIKANAAVLLSSAGRRTETNRGQAKRSSHLSCNFAIEPKSICWTTASFVKHYKAVYVHYRSSSLSYPSSAVNGRYSVLSCARNSRFRTSLSVSAVE